MVAWRQAEEAKQAAAAREAQANLQRARLSGAAALAQGKFTQARAQATPLQQIVRQATAKG